jgi:hypothetical protein
MFAGKMSRPKYLLNNEHVLTLSIGGASVNNSTYMKEYTSFLLSLVLFLGSLFPQTDVEEVFKIPQLVPHYLEHKQTVTIEFTFIDFLVMHYSMDSDHARAPHPSTNIPLHNFPSCL